MLGKYAKCGSKAALEIFALFFLVVKLGWLWEVGKVHADQWFRGAVGVAVGVAVTVGSRHVLYSYRVLNVIDLANSRKWLNRIAVNARYMLKDVEILMLCLGREDIVMAQPLRITYGSDIATSRIPSSGRGHSPPWQLSTSLIRVT